MKFNSHVKIGALLINPILGFATALTDVRSKSSYLVFFFVCVLFGVTFTAANEAADSFRYVEDFHAFSINAQSQFSNILFKYFEAEGEIKDLFVYLLYYLTHMLVGDNYHVFFFFVSMVFSTFYLWSMSFITDDENYEQTIPFMVLLFWFTYSNPIFNINGVRFWTAAWIAVLITFQVIINRRYWFTLFLPILPLVHTAYSLFIIVAIISWLLRKRTKYILPLFIISLMFSELALQYTDQISNYLPKVYQNMIWSYTESGKAVAKITGEMHKNTPVYAKILTKLPRYFDIICILILIKNQEKIEDEKAREMAGFLFIYYTIFNFMCAIPSISRYFWIAIPFNVYIWVRSYNTLEQYKGFVMCMPIFYCYNIYFWLLNMVSVSDPVFYFSTTLHTLIKNFA